jgi:hypothetical protein
VIDAVRASPLRKLFRPDNLVNHTRGQTGPKTTNMPTKGLSTNPSAPPVPPSSLPQNAAAHTTAQFKFWFLRHARTLLLASLASVPFGFELNRFLKVFWSKLRAPHRGTSLGPFVCGARACSLCS